MQTLEQLKSGQLLGIKRLQISESLTEFPSEIFELADSLEVLDLSNNKLDRLPSDLSRLHQLKILFLSNNEFEHIPDVMFDCPELEMIGFKANRIKTVAENAFPLKTRWLILTDNQIETLPESMGQLYRLQKLALAGNRLVALPNSMADCKRLELARISANQLISLPDWLFQLPRLSWLAFDGNPLLTSGNTSLSKNDSMIKVQMKDLELGEQLGEGASGVIYRAKWLNQPDSLEGTDSFVAVKLFKGEVTSDGYPKDELNCCLTAGDHPNLIKVVAQIAEKDQLGLVMELIPNTFYNLGLPPSLVTCTRDTFSEGTQFEPENITKVMLDMADAMSHLHQQGVSHGDVYAHNTMIDDNASALFGDFGASSDLSQLPVLQKEAMESIEVRAFGCLLDDLITLTDPGVGSEILSDLAVLRDDCMQSSMGSRPRFSDIKSKLLSVSELRGGALVC